MSKPSKAGNENKNYAVLFYFFCYHSMGFFCFVWYILVVNLRSNGMKIKIVFTIMTFSIEALENPIFFVSKGVWNNTLNIPVNKSTNLNIASFLAQNLSESSSNSICSIEILWR